MPEMMGLKFETNNPMTRRPWKAPEGQTNEYRPKQHKMKKKREPNEALILMMAQVIVRMVVLVKVPMWEHQYEE